MQIESRTCQACLSNYAEMQLCLRKSTKIFWNDKMFGGFLSIQPKKSRRACGLAGREVCERNVLFFNPVFNRNSFDSIEMLCIIRYHNHVIDNVFRNDWLSVFAFYTVEKWIGICLRGCGCYDFSFECSRLGQGTVPEMNPKSWTQHLLFICEEEH